MCDRRTRLLVLEDTQAATLRIDFLTSSSGRSCSSLKEQLIIRAAPRGVFPLISFLAVLMKCRRRGDGNHGEEGSECNVTAAEEQRG